MTRQIFFRIHGRIYPALRDRAVGARTGFSNGFCSAFDRRGFLAGDRQQHLLLVPLLHASQGSWTSLLEPRTRRPSSFAEAPSEVDNVRASPGRRLCQCPHALAFDQVD